MMEEEIFHNTLEEYREWLSKDYKWKIGLQLMHSNTRSLRSKLDEMENLLNTTKKMDALLLSETWLDNNDTDYYSIADYSFYHAMKTTGTGGGCAIYFNNDWEHNLIYKIEKAHRILAVCGRNPSKSITLICAYNPPINKIETFLDDLEETINNVKTKEL